MQPDKKQTVQLVVLGVLVVVFVGFLSFNFLAPKGHKAPPPVAKSHTDAAPQPGDEPAEVAEDAALDSAAAGVFPDLMSIPARRDPFLPQKLPGSEVETQRRWQAQPQPARLPIVKNPFGALPRMSVPPVNPFRTGAPDAGRLPAATAQPQDEPKFVLTGVVRGAESVAIIRTGERGDGGRYVVKQGQLIEGRYRVLYVTHDGVVLANGNRRIYVRLGGVKNAS